MHIVSSSCRYCRLSVQVDHDLKRKPNLLVDHMSCNMTENSTFRRSPPPPPPPCINILLSRMSRNQSWTTDKEVQL